MEKLMKGMIGFRRHVFTAYRDLFQLLAEKQRPEALFLTCADSRIVPNLITMTDPGDLFVVRNVGNVVPPHDVALSDEMSALEYAIGVLHVRDVIVCGHTGCGAMNAALSPPGDEMPHLKAWLRHTEPAVELLRRHYPDLIDPKQKSDLLSELNVLVQLDHVRTHPMVAERMAAGQLYLHAWMFEIESARLYIYHPEEEAFLPLQEGTMERVMKARGLGLPQKTMANAYSPGKKPQER